VHLGQGWVQRRGHDADAGERAAQRVHCSASEEEGEECDVCFWVLAECRVL
jgi:hypothetical protein